MQARSRSVTSAAPLRPNASGFALFAEHTDSMKTRKQFRLPSRKWSKALFQSALVWLRASESGLENALI